LPQCDFGHHSFVIGIAGITAGSAGRRVECVGTRPYAFLSGSVALWLCGFVAPWLSGRTRIS